MAGSEPEPRQMNSKVRSANMLASVVLGTRVKNQASMPSRLCSVACVADNPNGSRLQPTRGRASAPKFSLSQAWLRT